MTAQVRAPHPAGVVHVSEGPFDVFAAPTHEPLAPPPAEASPIAVDRVLSVWRIRPVAAPTSGSAMYDRTPIACRSTSVWLL